MQLVCMELVGGFVLFGVLVWFLFVCFVSGSNRTVEIQSLNREWVPVTLSLKHIIVWGVDSRGRCRESTWKSLQISLFLDILGCQICAFLWKSISNLILQPQRDFIFTSVTDQTFKYFVKGIQVKTTHVYVWR